jgi:hypothetical protein
MTSPLPSDPLFIAKALAWMERPEELFLGFVWAGYDALRRERPHIDTGDLERSITQLLQPRVSDAMSGDEPFYVQHGPYERETRASVGQPPEYDLAFVLRAEPRVMWPLEAKVLNSPGALADYLRAVREQFLTCRYAPFVSSAAMLGYLVSGTGDDALQRVEQSLGCSLDQVHGFESRPARVSAHNRVVPAGKLYPDRFRCYHLMLEFRGVRRAAAGP